MTPWVALGVLVIAAVIVWYLRWSDAFYGWRPFERFKRPNRSRADPQRIAELEYELGLTDQPPPGHFRGPHVGNIRTERIGDHFYEVHTFRGEPTRYIAIRADAASGKSAAAFNASNYRADEPREDIEAAGYEAIDITQFGDPEPRYIRGMRSR